MIITKKYLSRRTLLRGFGATLSLPLLDAMIPSLTALSRTAAKPARRLGVVYVPNGMAMPSWTPSTEGAQLALSPILQSLAPVREHILQLGGLVDAAAVGTGPHARASGAFLTGVPIKQTEGADFRAGVSVDQIAAREFGQETQLTSLELSLDSTELLGACDGASSCAYTNTIAWRTPTAPLPMESDPRAVFERLFGTSDSTDLGERLARIQEERSILDALSEKVTGLRTALGTRDRAKLGEYLDTVRDVERRIQLAERQSTRELPVVERPAGIPDTFEAHAKLIFDLWVLAYQTDLTRVVTFMMGRELSGRSYPEVGAPDSHHPLSHHQNNPEKLTKLAKINAYHVQMFTYLLEKLKATHDGDGTLLDHVMILYGAGISNSNLHHHTNLPILIAGGGAGQIKGGRHLQSPADTPLANLHLTLLDKLGVPMENFGDSNGMLNHLSGV